MKIERTGLIRGLTSAPVQRLFLAGILLALSAPGLSRGAQGAPGAPAGETPQKQESAAPSGGPDSAPAPMMEQRALDRLKRMSETLKAAKAFTVRSRSTVEAPAKTGQYVTLFGTSEIALQRPNKLRVKVTGEVPNFDFYYEGTNMAALAAQNNVYSIDKAPGTIDELLNVVEDKSDIHFAAADVMFSDPYAMLTKDLTSAFVVGPATVDGSPCEHLAFKSRGVHWEIWIDTGQSALPRCLAVTYAAAENLPRFLVEFSNWNLQPTLTADSFVFNPPANAKQIEFRAQVPTPTGRK
jgi:hypothetical protein